MIHILKKNTDFDNMRNRMTIKNIPRQYQISIIAVVVLIILTVWYSVSISTQQTNLQNEIAYMQFSQKSLVPTSLCEELKQPTSNQNIKPFSNDVDEFMKFSTTCYKGRKLNSIEDIIYFINLLKISKMPLCRNTYKLVERIYQVRLKYTTIAISDTFMLKVSKWLKGNKEMIKATKNQSLIFIDNLYTYESVVFNPVRSNRPGVSAGNVKLYIDKLVNDTSKSCDFCSYKNYTATDTFGYMNSDYSVVVSNTFKIEKYHGMVLFKQHNPVDFDQLQFIDAIHLALQWYDRTHKLLPDHKYRVMYWDILPKASASQIHPHMHLTLGDYSYYAKWNQLYHAGLKYTSNEGLNYWKDLLQVHAALALSFSYKEASLMVYLTPQKDYEVIIISKKPCLHFFQLAYHTIRSFMDDLQQYSLSMSYVFPKITSSVNDQSKQELPMMLRIITRGPADNTRSDVSSFDLFGTPNVNKDPFKVMEDLQKSLSRRTKEEFKYPGWTFD